MTIERYIRNYGELISPEDQQILLDKTCAVLGAGGNGGYVIEFLSRLGIKKIIIFDGDNFEISNLNRQIFCTEENIGCNKAIVAAKQVKKINSDITVEAYDRYAALDKSDIQILSNVDVIFDCTDYGVNGSAVANMLSNILFNSNNDIVVTYSANNKIGGFNSLHTKDSLQMYMELQKNNRTAPVEKIGQPAYMCAITAANDVAAVVKYFCKKKYDLTGEIFTYDLYHFSSYKEDEYGRI